MEWYVGREVVHEWSEGKLELGYAGSKNGEMVETEQDSEGMESCKQIDTTQDILQQHIIPQCDWWPACIFIYKDNLMLFAAGDYTSKCSIIVGVSLS